MLQAYGIRVLADIRTVPRSRTNPQYNLGAWQNASFRNYADYARTPAFAAGLDELIALAAEPVAIMCAEAVWWRCHRRIVADYLLVRGVPVRDLLALRPPAPHRLTPFAAVQPAGTMLYPVGGWGARGWGWEMSVSSPGG